MINKSEQEIMSLWKGDKSKPLVSICSLTYNHEEYIMNTLDSFLMQETDFPFEIIIHDDASTDNTQYIIKEYEKKFPSIIKAIYQTENKYSKGIKLSIIIFEKVQGEFIALCEGDDFWIDKHKLQIQISYMLKYPQYGLSFHKAKQLNILENNSHIIGNYLEQDGILDFESVLTRTYGMIPTASCILKRKKINFIINFFNKNPYLKQGDIYVQYLAAFDKGALYLDKEMSVYRYQGDNSWTKKLKVDYNFQIDIFLSKIKSFIALNTLFNNMHEEIFYKLCLGISCQLLTSLKNINSQNYFLVEELLIKQVENNLCKINLKNGLILYGASTLTEWFIDTFQDIKINYILDNNMNKSNTYFGKHKIIHPSEIIEIKGNILISLWGREYGIINNLIDNYNFPKNSFINIQGDIEIFNQIIYILEN